MVRKSEVLGGHLALLPTLVLLCTVSVKSSSTYCQGCSAEALFQAKQLIVYMKRPTQQLFKSYVRLNHLRKEICKKSVTWLPGGNITLEPIDSMLQELHRALEQMEYSLAQITEQQKSLQPPDSSLPGELQQALLRAEGLHVNARCALCGQGLTPASVALPARRTEPVFVQKVKGCQVLWGYSKFVSALAKAFQKQLNKKGRSGGTKKRSGQKAFQGLLTDASVKKSKD